MRERSGAGEARRAVGGIVRPVAQRLDADVIGARPLWPGAVRCWEVRSRPVSVLGRGEVFVFGSNGAGFHGAGSAGVALRGESSNTWRTDPSFTAMRTAPAGSLARRGRWAVFGVARGHQVGRAGQSYAIQTVDRPGVRGSITRREIYSQLRRLVDFAVGHPQLSFIVTPLGEGYAGFTFDEMSSVWRELDARHGIPLSLRFVRVARGR